MRLPTLGELVSVAQRTLRRFPFVLLAGVTAAYAAFAMIQQSTNEPFLVRMLGVASLGLPLMFALTVLGERRAHAAARWALPAAGIAVLAAIAWQWPSWPVDMKVTRYIQLSAAFHLFAAFAPFVGRDEPRAFWQFNRILFLRFLVGAVYSGVLWLGLCGALLALDKLLGIDIAEYAYARLWVLIAFVFNPWFFVAGIPNDIGALEDVDDYPTGLRVFTQFVLVPIVALYLVILTIYFGKVLVTREWPSGWIGYLVSSVAGVGTLSWLLVHPLEQRPEHAWVKGFTRGFHVAILPAIVMLWLAIGKRVEQYGMTEKRYFLVVLSLWLAGTALYYTFTRSRNIKLIPASLCALAVVTFVGPWGAYAVSLDSQRGRLEATLARHGLISDGRLVRATGTVSDSAAREIAGGFRYLLQAHGAGWVQPWIAGDLARTIGAIGSGNAARADAGARAIVTALELPYIGRWGGTSDRFVSFHARADHRATPIAGYTDVVRLDGVPIAAVADTSPALHARLVADPPAIEVRHGGALVLAVPLRAAFDSAQLRQRGPAGGGPPGGPIVIEVSDGSRAARAVLTQLSGTTAGDRVTLSGIGGELFVRFPRPSP